jgi:hypothetical protein
MCESPLKAGVAVSVPGSGFNGAGKIPGLASRRRGNCFHHWENSPAIMQLCESAREKPRLSIIVAGIFLALLQEANKPGACR